MADKTIRVSEDTWRRLRDRKRDDETFDEVVARLAGEDKWSGFGALSETGISEGMEDAHDRLESELRDDVAGRD